MIKKPKYKLYFFLLFFNKNLCHRNLFLERFKNIGWTILGVQDLNINFQGKIFIFFNIVLDLFDGFEYPNSSSRKS